jgi:hypothetical protein
VQICHQRWLHRTDIDAVGDCRSAGLRFDSPRRYNRLPRQGQLMRSRRVPVV